MVVYAWVAQQCTYFGSIWYYCGDGGVYADAACVRQRWGPSWRITSMQVTQFLIFLHCQLDNAYIVFCSI